MSLVEEASAAPAAVLRVAAISGSLRRASTNTGLIRAAAEICRQSILGLEIDFVDISELPLLNTDLEAAGGAFPAAVEAFRDADCFLFASPEYNYSISGPLKNALDWGSRPPNCWADRATAILSASGGNRSQYHIRQVGVFLDIHFVNKPVRCSPRRTSRRGSSMTTATWSTRRRRSRSGSCSWRCRRSRSGSRGSQLQTLLNK